MFPPMPKLRFSRNKSGHIQIGQALKVESVDRRMSCHAEAGSGEAEHRVDQVRQRDSAPA